jgi:hypothetical protein
MSIPESPRRFTKKHIAEVAHKEWLPETRLTNSADLISRIEAPSATHPGYYGSMRLIQLITKD